MKKLFTVPGEFGRGHSILANEIAEELMRLAGMILPGNGDLLTGCPAAQAPFESVPHVVSGSNKAGIPLAEKSPVLIAAVGTVVRFVVPCRSTKPS